MSFSIFKRTKVENAADFEHMVVVLPKSKKEMTISQIVNEMDLIQNMHGYANADHLVKVGEEEMSVKKLAKNYSDMMAEKKAAMEKNDAEDGENDKDADAIGNDQDEEEEPDLENEDDGDDMDNAADDGEEKKEPELANKKRNSADKKVTEKQKIANALAEKKKRQDAKKASGNVDKLMNASGSAADDEDDTVDLASAQLRRGQSRYGSGAA